MKTKGRGPCRVLDHLLVLGLAAMVLMVLGNVILRYLFNSGLAFSEEVSRFTFVWITFIGAIIAFREGLHLGMDTVVKRLGRTGRLVCYGISHLLMLWCCVLLWLGSWEQVKVNLGNHAPVSGLPAAAMYAVGLFTAACMGITIVHSLWKAAAGRIDTDALIDIRDSEGLPAQAVKEA